MKNTTNEGDVIEKNDRNTKIGAGKVKTICHVSLYCFWYTKPKQIKINTESNEPTITKPKYGTSEPITINVIIMKSPNNMIRFIAITLR